MKRALVLLFAACGGARPSAPNHSGGGANARIGAGLVEAGRSWTYAVGNTDGSHTTVTCKVASVVAIAGGTQSQVTCDGTLDAVAGTWALTADGLSFDATRVLAEPPKEGSVDASMPDLGQTTKTRRDDDGWCVEADASGEDGSSVTTTCFDADGVVRGSSNLEIDDAAPTVSSFDRVSQ